MSHPLSNVSSSTLPAPLAELTPRQRMEVVLKQLPAAGSAQAEAAKRAPAVAAESLVEPLQRINSVMRQYGVQFHIEQPSSPPVVRVTDQETGEVIRQIPAEETLRLAERLEEVRGILFSSSA